MALNQSGEAWVSFWSQEDSSSCGSSTASTMNPNDITSRILDPTRVKAEADACHGVSLSITQSLHLFVACLSLLLLVLWQRRRQTKARLERAGLPTVYWRPKFVHYQAASNDKLRPSSITGILPRMERLKGPYGMYGTVYGVSTGVVHVAHPVPAMAILSASLEKQPSSLRRRSSLSSSSGATKTPAYNHFKNFCGEGVFTADGDDWRAKRSAVMHALIRRESYEAKIEEEAHRSCCQLVQELEAPTGSVNVVPRLQRATIGLIYRYITHTDLNYDQRSVKESRLTPYLRSITEIRMIILAQSRSIWFLLPRWIYRRFSSLYRDEETTMGPIREFAIESCEKAIPGSPLAELQQLPIYSSGPTAFGSRFDKNILDETITLLFAGQDTSAATLSWTLHLLSLYPEVQHKLADELHSVLGNLTANYMLRKKTLAKLNYMDAVIKESMRLYPVAPFVVRRLPFALPIKSESGKPLILPTDSVACVWIYGLHRSPQFWSRPDGFVPERWLEEDPDRRDAGITNGAYMPFAHGPRNCVGQPLAHIILRSFLARLIHRFEFMDERLETSTADDLRKDMQAGFTVLPQNGVELRVVRRTRFRM